MRKPRDFDAELKSLEHKARGLRNRKVQQLGELVISTGADALSADELAGALIVLAETEDAGKREAWAKRGPRTFRAGRDELRRRLVARHWRRFSATQWCATVIRRHRRGMTCAPGRSSAASARDI